MKMVLMLRRGMSALVGPLRPRRRQQQLMLTEACSAGAEAASTGLTMGVQDFRCDGPLVEQDAIGACWFPLMLLAVI